MRAGIVTFAHNTQWDYLRMAKSLARRAEKYLHLPVTLVTDQETLNSTGHNTSEFDAVIVVERPPSNSKQNQKWLNKGRWSAYDLTPYDDTLVLDSDYVINSRAILKFFSPNTDFGCFRRAKYLFLDKQNEMISEHTLDTYWATGIRFLKSQRAGQVFEMIETIQKNWEYYSELWGFMPYTFRNDWALTIALRTVNGHIERPQDFFPQQLINIDERTEVIKISDTVWKFVREIRVREARKKVYLQTSDWDFHVLDKQRLLGVLDE